VIIMVNNVNIKLGKKDGLSLIKVTVWDWRNGCLLAKGFVGKIYNPKRIRGLKKQVEMSLESGYKLVFEEV